MATATVTAGEVVDLNPAEYYEDPSGTNRQPNAAQPQLASALPAGLSWDGGTLRIVGTTAVVGLVNTTIRVPDLDYAPYASLPFALEVVDGSGPVEPPRVSATAVVGELVELNLPTVLRVDVPADPVVEPVPAGLSHTGGGVLVGRPTLEGEVVVELLDGAALVGTVDVLVLPAGSQATDDPWAVWDDLAASLAPRVAGMVGRHGDESVIETAKAQLPLVAEYVRGYTRGRGFIGSSPAGALLAVIVSATARLATNPEQLDAYTMGDYSERPARLAGWTLAEIGVLHRYRVVSA